ncbi:type I restriction-modification system, specificity subunit S [Trabulsiella guamensis ATCC 49490]|uniref:Type I restriction-modification system, specificity subunit S n=1 Tax=Trabulsiella guamensis ATCC 49490 TaxID=1005994 RepID=A0A085AAT9_9ENTR|nr:Fic family protein [Trabulsiella guamensis]KFC07334.1 type I restriction-modification system, specificity subunit S [Trabulsiella guamensis ATCC 49490]
MSRYQPPFTITTPMLSQVAEIGELLGHWAARAGRVSPLLREENRIRTIQASLAIEHNSLNTEQVTAIMEGKRVLAPLKDIQEVRNAIVAYEKMDHWQSYQLADVLEAHKTLMAGLVETPGALRNGNVGIYRGSQLIHMAPPASQVPRLMGDLLHWLQETDLHPLVASSVFHYEFEFIHPFADGNGRMGRLWQTLILSEWRPELAWLPVETLIHHQQERYYQVLGECDKVSDCTAFVEFMLSNIIAVLKDGINDMSEEMSEKMSEKKVSYLTEQESDILRLLEGNPLLSAARIATILGVTSRTVERHLKVLQQKEKLQRVGANKGGYWQIK